MPKQKKNEIGFSFDNLIPEKYHTILLLLVIVLLLFIFFIPVMFGDKTISSGDLIQIQSMRQYALKEREGVSLWNPYIFCGMPAVVTSMSPRYYDLTAMLYSYASRIYSAAFKNYNAIYTFNLLILAITAFFLMRSFGASRGVSFLVAIATAFSTGIIVLFFIGHTTKLMSLSIFPFIMMMLFKFQKEIKLIDVIIFTIGLHYLVFGAHVQIVFYFGLVGLVYFIYFFIHSFIKKDSFLQKQLIKSLIISIVAAAVAILMSYDTYGQIYEYNSYSTRGTKSILEKQTQSTNSTSNSYEYATNWSFSPGEVLTFIVPSYYGFGKSTYQGPLTNNQPVEVNTYFGQMPFVDTAMYMGVIIFALAIFTLIIRWKESIIQFFGIIIVFFLLISFGKNFPVIYNLMYYHFPFFDKFRTPSMILHVLQIIFPILAGFGIMKIISLREEKNLNIIKNIKNVVLIIAALFFLSILLSGTINDWFVNRVKTYAASLSNQQESQMFLALSDYMADMFRSDLQIAMALLSITFGLIYAYLNSRINKQLLITSLAILIIFDLFRIGNRGASYVDAKKIDELFKEPDYVTAIKQQDLSATTAISQADTQGEKEPFRILNLKQDGSLGSIQNNGNYNVYFLLEDFFGYSAVKPRTFQDIIDVVSPVNITLWRMLNVKYIVTNQPYNPDGFVPVYQSANTFVYKNEKALPRIYFVDSVIQRKPIEILNAIKSDSFDPQKLVFLESENVIVDKKDSTTKSMITKYQDEHIIVETKSKGNNFLFFGTTYLPAWKAYIDGTETKIYKANYGFQGIIVPKGNHKVEFIYKPKAFVIGKNLSLILNIILYGSIILVIVVSRRKNK